MCLVKECREVEESFGTQHVEAVIRGNAAAAKEMKETIYQDGQKLVDRCWEKGKAVRGLQMLSRVMSHHGRGMSTV